MKKYQVVISAQAQESLDHIVSYLANSASDRVAVKVEKGLLETALNLSLHPHRYPMMRPSSKARAYRYVLKWSYKIIFAVDESEDSVIVIEMFHSSQDPGTLEDILD